MSNKAQITYRFERQPIHRPNEINQPNQDMVVTRLDQQGESVNQVGDAVDAVKHQQLKPLAAAPEKRDDRGVSTSKADESEKDVLPLSETVSESTNAREDADIDWRHFPTQLGPWQSPYDIETEELERIIRETDQEPPLRKKQENQDHYFAEFAEESDEQMEESPVGTEAGGWSTEPNDHRPDGQPIGEKAERDDDINEMRTERIEREDFYQTFSYDEPIVTSYRQRSSQQWGKMFMAVLGAIITGGLFGMFVLSLFTPSDSGSPLEMNSLVEQQSSGEVIGGGVVGDEVIGGPVENNLEELIQSEQQPPSILPDSEQVDLGVVSINIPSKSYYVLQNGMFSSAEGAETAMQQLTAQGFAAASELWDHHYVYAGITVNRDDALLLSHMLHEADYETYIKAINLPTVRAVQWKNDADSAGLLQEYLVQGNQVAEMISSLTVIHLQQADASDIDATFMTSISSAHQAWNSLSAAVHEGMPAASQATIQKMDTALNTAMISLEAYNKNPSFSYLWQAQTTLINYVILQKQLLQAIAVN